VTEAEWDACTSTGRLLAFVRDRLGARKLRLLACASVRQVWPALEKPGTRQAVEAGERYADGELTDAQMLSAWTEAVAAWQTTGDFDLPTYAAMDCAGPAPAAQAAGHAVLHAGTAAAKAAAAAAGKAAADQVFGTWERLTDSERRAADAARQSHAARVRCIAGNPFRPVALAPAVLAWRDGLLVSTARRMYEARDFSEMPVLADMLEEAGCREEQVLTHCRGPGPHARGCFVVDLVRSVGP
jgi:hypothetical protein